MLPNYVAQLFLIGKEEEWINRQLNFFFLITGSYCALGE
ncbi:hypothetical protein L150_02728 [Candida albicans Ca529L]|nr:hypothetical protein L150_02728 [Candida albicans Ca529L]